MKCPKCNSNLILFEPSRFYLEESVLVECKDCNYFLKIYCNETKNIDLKEIINFTNNKIYEIISGNLTQTQHIKPEDLIKSDDIHLPISNGKKE